MFVAGTLEDDQELIQNIATVMQGARVATRGAIEDEDQTPELKLELTLSGRDPPEAEPEGPE